MDKFKRLFKHELDKYRGIFIGQDLFECAPII